MPDTEDIVDYSIAPTKMAERSATWLIGSEPEARPFGQGGQVGRAREEPRLENLNTILVDIHQVINSHKIQRSSEKKF